MTSPNNFLNRYNQFPYPVPLNSWGFPPGSLYGVNGQIKYGSFQQPFNYSYMFAQPNYYTLPQLSSFNLNPPPSVVQPAQMAPPVAAEEKIMRGINKIQKKQKKREVGVVIEISDDEASPQQEKSSEDKSTSASNKINTSHLPINTKINQEIPKQIKAHPTKEEKKVKQKNQGKLGKTKQISKNNNNKKNYKGGQLSKKVEEKQPHIVSQRIIQKNGVKKQVYRLSKKERQLLQINFLRETNNEILTGPQFQAKLPPFISQPSNLQVWKKEMKNHLLERLEKDQE